MLEFKNCFGRAVSNERVTRRQKVTERPRICAYLPNTRNTQFGTLTSSPHMMGIAQRLEITKDRIATYARRQWKPLQAFC